MNKMWFDSIRHCMNYQIEQIIKIILQIIV